MDRCMRLPLTEDSLLSSLNDGLRLEIEQLSSEVRVQESTSEAVVMTLWMTTAALNPSCDQGSLQLATSFIFATSVSPEPDAKTFSA